MRFMTLILLLLSLLLFTGCKVNISEDKFSVEWKEGKVDITDKEFKVKSVNGYESEITEDKFEVKTKDWTKVKITESWLNLDINDEEIGEVEDVVKGILK